MNANREFEEYLKEVKNSSRLFFSNIEIFWKCYLSKLIYLKKSNRNKIEQFKGFKTEHQIYEM